MKKTQKTGTKINIDVNNKIAELKKIILDSIRKQDKINKDIKNEIIKIKKVIGMK
ncbi:MAG: hypothetical protein HUJ52_02160 [Malacoplasma sp.]|nr:hypothetical protein [Malacoplasma sp.]